MIIHRNDADEVKKNQENGDIDEDNNVTREEEKNILSPTWVQLTLMGSIQDIIFYKTSINIQK